MRKFNVMAAVAVALLAGGVAAAAEEQPAKPKVRKICRLVEDSTSRIGTRRVCRTIVEKTQPVHGAPQQDAARPAEAASPSH